MSVRLENIGIVVTDLDPAIAFFTALGLRLDGRTVVEGDWAGRVTGLGAQRVEVAMLTTPDGHGGIELSRFIEPAITADHRRAPVNSLGYLRAMLAVEDLDAALEAVRAHGGELISSDVVEYSGVYRLCYVRGPEGILLGLAEELSHG